MWQRNCLSLDASCSLNSRQLKKKFKKRPIQTVKKKKNYYSIFQLKSLIKKSKSEKETPRIIVLCVNFVKTASLSHAMSCLLDTDLNIAWFENPLLITKTLSFPSVKRFLPPNSQIKGIYLLFFSFEILRSLFECVSSLLVFLIFILSYKHLNFSQSETFISPVDRTKTF